IHGPPGRYVHSISPQLLAADDGVALDFDLGFGNGQGGDGDEGAAGEIVAEYFAPELREAIAVAHVGDEHRHLHHVAELAAGLFERCIDELEDLPHLSVEIAGKRLAGIVDDRELSGQPHDLAALGDHRLRVAARLRTLALEELLGVERSREAKQQRRRDEADESARGCRRNHLRLLRFAGPLPRMSLTAPSSFPDAVGALRQHVQAIKTFARGDVEHALVRSGKAYIGGLPRHFDRAEIPARGVEYLNAGDGRDVDAILAIERHAVGAALLAFGDVAQLREGALVLHTAV